jgi:hypothetical protein
VLLDELFFYLIILSALASMLGGFVRPICFAVCGRALDSSRERGEIR